MTRPEARAVGDRQQWRTRPCDETDEDDVIIYCDTLKYNINVKWRLLITIQCTRATCYTQGRANYETETHHGGGMRKVRTKSKIREEEKYSTIAKTCRLY